MLLSRPGWKIGIFFLKSAPISSLMIFCPTSSILSSVEIASFSADPFLHWDLSLSSSEFDKSALPSQESSAWKPCRTPPARGRRPWGSRRRAWGRPCAASPWCCGGGGCHPSSHHPCNPPEILSAHFFRTSKKDMYEYKTIFFNFWSWHTDTDVWKERKLLEKRHEISTNLRCLHLGGAEDILHGGLSLPPPCPGHQPHLEPELGGLLGAPLGPALGGGGAAADGHPLVRHRHAHRAGVSWALAWEIKSR